MLILSLIGNPVKIGDGPAAVTLPFSEFVWKKEPFWPLYATFQIRMGRPLKGRGSQKTCLNKRTETFEKHIFLLDSRKAKILTTDIHSYFED